MKRFSAGLCLLLSVAVLTGWGPERRLMETSYPLTQDIQNGHMIRVQVGESTKAFGVSSPGAFVVESSSGVLARGAKLNWTGVEMKQGGIRFGTKTFQTDSIFIRSPNGPGIRFNQRLYLNGLEVKVRGGRMHIINYIDVETYIKGVLPFEANPNWPDTTLRAHAVVSRTFAIFKIIEKRRSGADYDVGSGVLSQVYAGENVRHEKTDLMVDQTHGEVLLYRGEIFPAYFHSASGGATTSADRVWSVKPHPSLQGVICEFCVSSKHGPWSFFATYAEMEKAVRDEGGLPVRAVREVKLKDYDKSGRASEIEFLGRNGRFKAKFSEFRAWMGGDKLKSTLVTRYLNDPKRGGVTFFGRGWGHGVGLDQYGAKYMGELGYSALQILDFFYPGSSVEKIY